VLTNSLRDEPTQYPEHLCILRCDDRTTTHQ
jgi:hypothetical protein